MSSLMILLCVLFVYIIYGYNKHSYSKFKYIYKNKKVISCLPSQQIIYFTQKYPRISIGIFKGDLQYNNPEFLALTSEILLHIKNKSICNNNIYWNEDEILYELNKLENFLQKNIYKKLYNEAIKINISSIYHEELTILNNRCCGEVNENYELDNHDKDLFELNKKIINELFNNAIKQGLYKIFENKKYNLQDVKYINNLFYENNLQIKQNEFFNLYNEVQINEKKLDIGFDIITLIYIYELEYIKRNIFKKIIKQAYHIDEITTGIMTTGALENYQIFKRA